MQATWFELSSGRAYLAKGEVGPALKRLLRVDAHFGDFQEDQFDFHGYCIRKQVGASRVWCMASVCVGEGGGGTASAAVRRRTVQGWVGQVWAVGGRQGL